MSKLATLPTLLILLIFALPEAKSQDKIQTDTVKIYRFELDDGSEFIGNIIEEDSSKVVIRTSSLPKIEIPRAKISKQDELANNQYKKGSYWFPNPHATRYLITPSAFTLKKGEGYYQNTWIFLNSFNLGLSNHVSLGGGIEFISTFSSLAEGSLQPIFFITPKVSFEINEKFYAGAGILYLRIPISEGNMGILYSIATYGNTDNNVTMGLGWGFIGEELAKRPVITISGMKRVSRKVGLVTENWIIPADGYKAVFSYGVRFFGEKIAIDLAFYNEKEIAQYLIIGIPYVDFVVKF